MPPQRKIGLFLFLTLSLSMLSYIPIIHAGTGNIQGGLFVLTLMWLPGLAATLTPFLATRSLRGLGWRFGSARWPGVAYFLPVVYTLPVYIFTWLTGLWSTSPGQLVAAVVLKLQFYTLVRRNSFLPWSLLRVNYRPV